MSQVLQWTQFCALITRRSAPFSSATNSYTPGRAVALLGSGVTAEIDGDRNGRILQRQVRRLVLLVVDVGDEHRSQPVEGQLAVGLRVLDLRALGRRLEVVVVGFRRVNRPWRREHADLRQEPMLDAGHQFATSGPFLNHGLKLRLCCSSA